MSRCGTCETHCCWLRGKMCRFVVPSERPGYKWDCLLRREYGSWRAAYRSKEYVRYVQPFWDTYPIPDMGCGDFPSPGVKCHDCGEAG